MKKCFILAQRNIKEMLREPLSLVFLLRFSTYNATSYANYIY